nr:hypothetical protein CFP56_06929 [Quercus suber]
MKQKIGGQRPISAAILAISIYFDSRSGRNQTNSVVSTLVSLRIWLNQSVSALIDENRVESMKVRKVVKIARCEDGAQYWSSHEGSSFRFFKEIGGHEYYREVNRVVHG